MSLVALTREVSPAFANCELTHLVRQPIDLQRARAQHTAYEQALRELGCSVGRLPSDGGMPDAVFIEDVAIVLDEIAIVTRPGAPSRRVERVAVEDALSPHRPLARIELPGTIDGGDVLVVGRRVFVGLSSRTNRAAIEQLTAIVAPYNYRVEVIQVEGCLHLKSAVTAAADDALLINRGWISAEPFAGFDIIDVAISEPHGANVVRVNDRLLYPAAFPRTGEQLAARGFAVMQVDVSELAKAEGAVTCCSLIFTSRSLPEAAPPPLAFAMEE